MTALLLVLALQLGPTDRIENLRCDGRVDAVSVDSAQPRFSWWLQSVRHGAAQSAYQVAVSLDGQPVWDSGRVPAPAAPFVRYGGPPLASMARYRWRVRVWDENGRGTMWSDPASLITGQMRKTDWLGRWIGVGEKAVRPDVDLGYALEDTKADVSHWLTIDLGQPWPLERVALHPMRHNDPPAGGWIDGYGFPLRYRLLASEQPDFANASVLADRATADVPNPGWRPVVIEASGVTARYLKLEVTRLWHRGGNLPHVYTLGEIEAFSGGRNVALGAAATASASAEVAGWSLRNITDGKALAKGTATPRRRVNAHGAIYLRRQVTLPAAKSAIVCFSGLGFSELSIDGQRVGDYTVAPGFTTYNKRVQYLTFDVTARLRRPGRHLIEVTLVDGWYALARDPWVHRFESKPYVDEPKLLLDLRLIGEDGSQHRLTSDEHWQWAEGEITNSDIPVEDHDLRRTARKWQPVVTLEEPAGRLVAQLEPFTRVRERLTPSLTRWDSVSGTAVWQLGREVCGRVRLTAAGQAGDELTVTTLPTEPRPRVSRCILSGRGKETYAPHFLYVGMKEVQASGLRSRPRAGDLQVELLSSLDAPASGFHCSDDWQNWLRECVRRTSANYTTWLPNDPVREWKAWVQDIQTMFWSNNMLFDAPGLYERWQEDMADCQNAEGNFANIAPGPDFDWLNSTWWGGCAVWLPWEWYLYHGDDRLLREGYTAGVRYAEYLARQQTDAGQDWGLLDWLPVEETPRPIINTPGYYHCLQVLAASAELLGLLDEAAGWRQRAAAVADQFNQRYLDPVTGIIGERGWQTRTGFGDPPKPLEQIHHAWWPGDRPCTQAGQVLPLALGMVPAATRAKAEAALLAECAAHGNHLSTGFVSTPYLLRVLGDLAPEVAWAMTSASDYPSWWSMTRGSGNDLLKETWAGGMALMPSLGGSVASWQMEYLAGIRPDVAAPGFRRFVIAPQPAGSLKWVDAWFDSPLGRIKSAWRIDGELFRLTVSVPPGSAATVRLPTDRPDSVTVNDRSVAAATIELGSGRHRLTAAARLTSRPTRR